VQSKKKLLKEEEIRWEKSIEENNSK